MNKYVRHTLRVCQWTAAASFLIANPAQAALDCAVFVFSGGTSIVNSGGSLTGDICYNENVTSTQNQKLPDQPGDWVGGAYVHSGVTDFQYNADNFNPSDGIHESGFDLELEALDAAYIATANFYQAQTPDQTISSIWATDQSINSSGGGADTTIINFTSSGGIGFNSNTLTLTGDSDDKYIFNFEDGAEFDWSQSSTILLNGVTADNILFNFWGDIGGTGVIKKDATSFKGTILAPFLTEDFEYHNPASFEGAIFANKVNLHSDFNLDAGDMSVNVFTPVPVPPAIFLFGSAIGLFGLIRRKVK